MTVTASGRSHRCFRAILHSFNNRPVSPSGCAGNTIGAGFKRPILDRQQEYPYFFSGGDQGRVGQFDHGQRELYISAYLRTLAHASITGSIPHEVAEHYAMLALTMNRGLADLEPINRPNWARNLLPCDARGTKELAQKLWACAEAATKPGEVPLALRVVDFDTKDFVRIRPRR